MNYSMPGFPVLYYILEYVQTHVHLVSDAIQTSNHHFLLLLPSIFPSIRIFSSELDLCIRWPKDQNFSFNISPSNKYSRLISFRIDLFDLLAVQGTQVSSPAPQFESINSFVLSFLYGPTLTFIHDYWKNHNFDYNGLTFIFNDKYSILRILFHFHG